MCRQRFLIIMGMILLLAAPAARAQDDNTQQPPTLNEQIRTVLAKSILADDLPAPQDAPAARGEFLQQCTARLAAIYPVVWYAPSLAELERQGRQLLTDTPNDPTVVLLYGLIRNKMNAPADAALWLKRGLAISEEFPASGMFLRAMATAALAECSYALGENRRRYWYDCVILTSWVINDIARYDQAHQGALLEVVNEYILAAMPLNPSLHLVDRCASLPDTTEWMCKMLAAQVHIAGKLNSRPAIYYPEFQSDFQPDIDKAQRLLRAATVLRPDLPQGPTQMLHTLYRDQRGYEPTQATSWFDLATTVAPSYMPAYVAYSDAVMRSNYWGRESYLAQLANRCLSSEAYDTAVPAYYLLAVYNAGKASNNYDWDPKAFLRGHSANINRIVQGYRDTNLPPSDLRDITNAVGVIAAAITRDWAAGREALDAIDNLDAQMPLLERHLAILGTSPVYVLGQIYAETGPRAEMLTEARSLYRDKKYDESMALLTEMVRQEDINGFEIAYLHSAAQYVLTTKELQADRWINIMPDPLLTGWTIDDGGAWVDSAGRLICMPGPSNNFRLSYDRPVGTQFEYRGTVTQAPTSNTWQAGFLLGDNDSWSYYQLLLSRSDSAVLLMDRRYSEFSWSRPISQSHTLDVLCWNQQLTIYIDDELFQDQLFVSDLQSTPESKIGVSSYYSYAPTIYDSLQFRLLNQAQQLPPGQRTIPLGAPISTYRPAYMSDEQLPALRPVSLSMQTTFTATDLPLTAAGAVQRLDAGWNCSQLFLPAPAVEVLALPDQPEPNVLYSGNTIADSAFVDTLQQPGYLIGLRFRVEGGAFGCIQPVYRTDTGRTLGGRNGMNFLQPLEIIATDGYAVGGMAVNGESRVEGLQLIFMRITPDGELDPNDQYRSQWMGNPANLPVYTLDDEDITRQNSLREFAVNRGAVIGMVGDFQDTQALVHVGLVVSDRADMRGVALPPEMPPVSELTLPAFIVPDNLLQAGGRYYLPLGLLTHAEAQAECQRLGGHLPRLESPDDAALMHRLLLTMPDITTAWLDASFDAEGQVAWNDGQARETFLEELAPDSPLKPGRPTVLLAQPLRAVTDSTEPDAVQFTFCQWDTDPRPVETRPAGPFPGAREFNGCWYAAVALPLTFAEAQQLCQLMGGSLAIIPDADTNTFIASLAGGEPFWIGLASDDEGQWHWADGQDLAFDRLQHSPRLTPNMAAVLHPTFGYWVESQPDDFHGFVCQWDNAPAPEAWTAYNTERFQLTATVHAATPAGIDVPDLDPIEFEGHWYQAFPQATTWAEAKARCEAMGGQLIVIETDEENTFASFFVVGPQALWIGLSDTEEEGTWAWVDGTTPTFTAWAPGEPNDWGNNEDYAYIGLYQEGPTIYPLWNDYHETPEYGFLCEWDYDPTAETSPADDAANE